MIFRTDLPFTELCFWLFLVNLNSFNHDWFRTLYFKVWVVGSGIATIYMPLVTILTRSDLGKVCSSSLCLVVALKAVCAV